jgi:hypothetical protein
MRISKKVVEAISVQQFDDAMAQYAKAALSENDILQLLEKEMNRIREKYAGELAHLGEQKKKTMELIETYCREQKSLLFCKRRSFNTLYGAVGFRMGKLKEQLPEYVRKTEEPAKDLLLADRYKERVALLLRDIGLEVVQEETFFIELKKTGLQNV